MPCQISVRDIDFHASATGVRIRVTTDAPAHLFVRLSSKHPWIHKKPSLRRGVAFAEDVRFCFTVFEDNEQLESGDTLEHTWWKKNWPVCTTKWLYVWGKRAGETCLSTTAPFEYHNDGVSPVPPPEPMYQLNAIDPEFYHPAIASSWRFVDLSRDIPEDATGALLQIWNKDPGAESLLALRKPGAHYDNNFDMKRDGNLWVIVGLDSQRRFECKFERAGQMDCYLMGWTGRNVVFPDDPIDIKPSADNAYSTFDIGATWPDAKLLLTDLGSHQSFNAYHSIRPDGSSKELFGGSRHRFPFCGIPSNGKIQTKLYQRGGVSTKWLAYAYFKEDCSFSLNGINYDGFTSDAWKTLDCSLIGAGARFAFLEYIHPHGNTDVSARKNDSYFNFAHGNGNHGYFITHVHHDSKCQAYSGVITAADYLYGIAETH
ncbi:hypothetical protein ES705_39396 [subsurface metagenome]